MSSWTGTPRRCPPLVLAIVAFVALGWTGCGQAQPPVQSAATTSSPASSPAPIVATPREAQAQTMAPAHDLARDERMGGHTLARHVGKSDEDLAARLQRERDISAASTYTDRETAERIVAAALDSSRSKVDAWSGRTGHRPNLVLHYADRAQRPIGRSLSRGSRSSRPCTRALVVLRWDERAERFFVLTSYPESDR